MNSARIADIGNKITRAISGFLYVIGFNALGLLFVLWTDPSFIAGDRKFVSALLLLGGLSALAAGYASDGFFRRARGPETTKNSD